jgi:hypothetical protein
LFGPKSFSSFWSDPKLSAVDLVGGGLIYSAKWLVLLLLDARLLKPPRSVSATTSSSLLEASVGFYSGLNIVVVG